VHVGSKGECHEADRRDPFDADHAATLAAGISRANADAATVEKLIALIYAARYQGPPV
jgi:hypothetical protein